MDADLVADLGLGQVEPFVTLLGGEFYVDDEAMREAIHQRSSFNIIHRETMFKVDVFCGRHAPMTSPIHSPHPANPGNTA
jgi:hypothetical protein